MIKIEKINYIEKNDFENHLGGERGWSILLSKVSTKEYSSVSSLLIERRKIYNYIINMKMHAIIQLDLKLFSKKKLSMLPVLELEMTDEIQVLVQLLFTKYETGDNSYYIEPAVRMIYRKLNSKNIHNLKRHFEIYKLINYIQVNLSNGFSIIDLSEYMYMSDTSLRRFCEKHIEKTPMQLISDIRICESKSYLENSQVKIKDIAQLVGFQNSASFFAFFRQKTGFSPSEYRYFSKNYIDKEVKI